MNLPKKTTSPAKTAVPADLLEALHDNPQAMAQWSSLTPISRRDFISWIESAKQEVTRKRRVEVACSKLVAGKRRPCCYAIVPMNFYKALGADPQAKANWSTLTPDGRRDLVSWVEAAETTADQKLRVIDACKMLAVGKLPY